MAKITNLTVGTIKIGNTALTATVQAAYSNGAPLFDSAVVTLAVPSNYGNPVILFWTCFADVVCATSGTSAASISVKRGTTVFYSNSVTVNAGDSSSQTWHGSWLDKSPGTSYSINSTLSKGAGGASKADISGSLMAMTVKA